MKRSIPLLALLILAAACGGEDAPSSPTTVARQSLATFQGDGFSVGYPPDWTVAPEAGLVTFTAPEPIAGFTDNFNVSFGEVPDTLRTVYYQGEVERLRSFFGPIEIFEDLEVTVDGVPARAITFTAVQGDTVIGISRLIVLKDDVAYEITFFSTQQRLFELTPIVQDVLASLQIVP